MKYSKIDIAYEILDKRHAQISFYDLWKEVCKIVELDDDKAEELISYFYTDLSLDGRFITLGENTWDLRKNHPFDKVHIDMNDVYSDDVIEDEEYLLSDEREEDLFDEVEVNRKLEAVDDNE